MDGFKKEIREDRGDVMLWARLPLKILLVSA